MHVDDIVEDRNGWLKQSGENIVTCTTGEVWEAHDVGNLCTAPEFSPSCVTPTDPPDAKFVRAPKDVRAETIDLLETKNETRTRTRLHRGARIDPLCLSTLVDSLNAAFYGIPRMQIMESGRGTYAGDIYSFGIIVWEVISTELPWAGKSFMSVVYRVSKGDRPAFHAHAPEDIANIARACWAQRPEERPTFDALLEGMTATGLSVDEGIGKI